MLWDEPQRRLISARNCHEQPCSRGINDRGSDIMGSYISARSLARWEPHHVKGCDNVVLAPFSAHDKG